MSGLDASEIFVAGTGNICSAAADTAMPTDVTSPIAAPWIDHGYATEDGVEFTFGKTTDELKGWQSFDTLRLLTTEAPKSLKFTLMQANVDNLLLAMGGGTTDSSTGVYTPPDPSVLDIRALYIRANDGGDVWAFWAARVLISDNVVIPWVKSGEAQLPLTFAIQAAEPAFQFVFPPDWTDTNGGGTGATGTQGVSTSGSTGATGPTGTAQAA